MQLIEDSNNESTDPLQKYLDYKNKAKALLSDLGLDAIKPKYLNVLNAHPEIDAIGFTAYTPYFNDGEPCEYGVGPHSVRLLADFDDEPFTEEDCYIGDWADEWTLRYAGNKVNGHFEPPDDLKSLYTDLVNLDADIDHDLYMHVFGDHVQVVVTRDTIIINEYSHD